MNLWRSWGRTTYVWDRTGGLPASFALVSGAGSYPLVTQAWTPWADDTLDAPYQTGLVVPASVPDGAYTLNGVPFQVVTQTTPAFVPLVPGQDLEAAIRSGANLSLAPGRYTTQNYTHLSPGQQIVGSSRDAVEIVCIPNGDYASRQFAPAPGAAFRNLTISGVSWYLFHNNVGAANFEMTNCRVVGEPLSSPSGASPVLGEWDDGSQTGSDGDLFRDCVFENVGAGCTAGALFHRCTFTRSGFGSLGGDRIVLLDCLFDQCGRGVTSSAYRGPLTNGLYAWLRFRNAQQVDNGGELFLVESGPYAFSGNLIAHPRAGSSDGPLVEIGDVDCHDNCWIDLQQDGGGGILFLGSPAKNQSNNLFRHGELRGGCVYLGRAATGNTFDRVAFVDPRPTRGNQYSWLPQTETDGIVHYPPHPILSAALPGNLADNCQIWGAPAGWPTTDTWTLNNVTRW